MVQGGPPMLTQESRGGFTSFLLARGWSVEAVEPRRAAMTMIDWYAEVRADDAAGIDDDGDMLLFQWGTYDWGEGRSFEVGITRQLILASAEDDDAIWQLSMTFRYTPAEATDALAKGHHWCYRPSDAAEFRSLLAGHQALVFTADALPIERELRLENTG
jgi:hypothetical protein